MRCRVILLLGIGLLAVAAAVPPAWATTQEQAVAELGLSATVGFGGQTVQDTWRPVTIGLAPRRAVAGTLSVRVSGPTGLTHDVVTDVEVASGTRKEFPFVVPPGRLSVRFAEAGGEPVEIAADSAQTPGYLVGQVGTVSPTGRPPLRVEPLGRTGTWVDVDPGWLARPRALESLGGLVMGVEDLEALGRPAAASVAAAVAAGLDLVVAAPADGPVDLGAAGIPWSPAAGTTNGRIADPSDDAWTVSDDDFSGPLAATVRAGHGRVSIVAGAPDGGAPQVWSTVTGPGAGLSEDADVRSLAAQPFAFPSLFASGGTLPRIPWLAAFLVGYVLLVGPVNWLVLARGRRRELAWVTVPIVTAVFTGGALLTVTGSGAATGLAGSAAWWMDGAGTEVVAAAVRAPGDGRHTLSLDGAWAVRPGGDSTGDARVSQGPPLTFGATLRALQIGGLVASRPVTGGAPLEVTASVAGAELTVEVTNTTAEPVRDVVVLAAGRSRSVGDLEPGRTELVDLSRADRLPVMDFSGPLDIGRGMTAARPPDESGAPDPRAFRVLLAQPVLDGGPGVAWAIGSRSGQLPDIRAGGGPVDDRGTVVATGARVAADADRVPASAVGRAVFTSGQIFARTSTSVEGSGDLLARFRLPGGTDPSATLRAEPFPVDGTVEVWDPAVGAWLAQDRRLPAPVAELADPTGQVWLRVTGWQHQLNFSPLGLSIGGES